MPLKLVTFEVFQVRGWLNTVARWNIWVISATLDVSQWPIAWLNNGVVVNIALITVTFEVSHLPMGLLKDVS
eukprot:2414083-Rhodomonas_salina.1